VAGVTDGSDADGVAGVDGAAADAAGAAAGGCAVVSGSLELQAVTSVNATAAVAAHVKIFRITAPTLLDDDHRETRA
jgi:hypothetical protein